MRTRGIVFALSVFALLSLGGCTWYLTDDGYYYDDDSSWFCEGDRCFECEGSRCWPVAGECTSDEECAEGCYCVEDGGWCEESGFCSKDEDCRDGFVCDERGTCIPAPGCDDSTCEPGSSCNEAGECEPETCQDNSECPDGSVCDIGTNECVPGEPDEPGACNGEINEATCNRLPPPCDPSSVPAIVDGCWVDNCILRSECEGEARLTCEELRTESQLDECVERFECARTTVEICTPKDTAPNDTVCRELEDEDKRRLCDCVEGNDICQTRTAGEAPFL